MQINDGRRLRYRAYLFLKETPDERGRMSIGEKRIGTERRDTRL